MQFNTEIQCNSSPAPQKDPPFLKTMSDHFKSDFLQGVYGCGFMRNSTNTYWGAVLIVKILSFTMTSSLLQWWFQKIMSPMPIKKHIDQAANIHQCVCDSRILLYYIQLISSLNLLTFIAFLSPCMIKLMFKGSWFKK